MSILIRFGIKVKSWLYTIHLKRKENVIIKGKISLDRYSDIFVVGKAKLSIGSIYMNSYSTITARYDVSIGSNVMFGENVHLYDHNHIFNKDGSPFTSQGYNNRKVSIGDNCWIGTGVTILAGATIGNNCVIGAGCTISGIIPDNSLVKSENNYTINTILFEKECR